MDVLADLLVRAQARGAVFARSSLAAPWGLEFRDDGPLSFHAVLEGELWVETEGHAPLRLLQGDLVLVRSDAPYRFVHEPGAPARALEAMRAVGPRAFAVDGRGPRTRILCGGYSFQGSVCDSLLAALPVLVPLHSAEADGPLRAALALLAGELGSGAPGEQAALDRLLDVLLIFALRVWFTRPDAEPPSWYAALADPVAGTALRALHADPGRPWTVAALAAEAGLSRAAFARRFAAAVGEAPLGYLTRWRMALAADALLQPGATLAGVAREVGYANEFALSAAFKRHHGAAPGRWRRERTASAAGG